MIWTDKIYTILSVLIKGNSETLICEETFLHKSISKYVRLRYRILRYIYSLLHHCTAANLDQISLRYFQYQFFSSGHFSLDSVYILCLFSRSYCLIIDVFTSIFSSAFDWIADKTRWDISIQILFLKLLHAHDNDNW